jgi:signal transduction histidine kinase
MRTVRQSVESAQTRRTLEGNGNTEEGITVWQPRPAESIAVGAKTGGRSKDASALRYVDLMNASNKTLASAMSNEDFVQEVCREIVKWGGYRRAWVYWNGGNGITMPIQTGSETGAAPAVRRSGTSGSGDSVSFRLSRRDRTFGILHVSAAPGYVFEGEESALLSSMADFLADGIALLDAEAMARAHESEKRDLAGQAARVEEAERRHLSREMHDVFGQSFTLLKCILYRVERNPEKTEKLLKEAGSIIDELACWARNLMVDFEMRSIRERELTTALQNCFDRYTARTGIKVHFEHSEIPGSPPYETSLALSRIVQEALTNVARYAGVQEVEVSLRSEGEHLRLQVTDHGKGFTPGFNAKTFGIRGMQERAHLLRGEFELDSSPGAGTQITVMLPVSASQDRPGTVA